jgi:hypothetical protein
MDLMDLILKIISTLTPVAGLYIAYLGYKLNKQIADSKCKPQQDNEKSVLPPRKKRFRR